MKHHECESEKLPPAAHPAGCECSVCSAAPYERNRYWDGKCMTVRDFTAEQRYFNGKRWLLNRLLHGWGVVCGLDLSAEGRCVRVSEGLALDCCGREILVCGEAAIRVEPPLEDRDGWVLCLEYLECPIEPVKGPAGCCEGGAFEEHNRVREHYRLSLRDPITLHALRCRKPLCPQGDLRRHGCDAWGGIEESLCRSLAEGCPECRDPCVPLGLIHVIAKQDGKGFDVKVDPCAHRCLVYSNPVLAELFHCYHGDLPRICSTNFDDWDEHESVPWRDFAELLRKGLRITFSEPMEPATVNRRTFLVAVLIKESGTGYRVRKYLPGRVKLKEGHDVAVFRADKRWIKDELEGEWEYSKLSYGMDVEIEVRGDKIRSKRGKALDAEDVARPSGNGVEGGTFLRCFTVGRRRPARVEEHDNEHAETGE